MAVGVDATGTALIQGTTPATSATYTGITVGASLSNGALIFLLNIGAANNHTTGFSATWDSGGTNQAMTQIGFVNNGSGGGVCMTAVAFGLRNPTAGNKTLAFSWTTADDYTCEAISLTGVEQSSDAAAFKNFQSTSTGASAAAQTVTITSAVGDMVIGLYATGSFSSINNTLIFSDTTTTSGPDSAACRAAGAASVTVTGTPAASNGQSILGFDVAAATATDTLQAQAWF